MSIKETLRKRHINYRIYEHSSILARDIEKEKVLQKRIELKNSPEYKQDIQRRKIVQQLDKANKNASSEQKLENTINYTENLIKQFTEEYLALENKTEAQIKKLLVNYKLHIGILVKFDNENELNNTNYTKKLSVKFVENIIKLNPIIKNIFMPKAQKTSSVEV